MQLGSLLIAALSLTSIAIASPTGSRLVSRASTPNAYGVNNGFHYRWWTDGQGNATYTNGPGGSYTVDWTNSQGDFYGGKGWSPGSPTRVAHYEGTFKPNGNAYLGLYGFNKSPYGDHRVMESYGTYNPIDYVTFPVRGQITCDGATYDVIDILRYPQGFEPMTHQIHSIRNPKLPNGYVKGTINFACHLAGWASLGLNVEIDPTFQIIATEAYFSSGFSNITVS
ncbi:hypothetical protein CVT24_007694 [Panaeolus cyanescens]|uniref:endo-1,4-beta-xylanase n=1 Tax=Panaeolus cyanescens TaxID=181874 RepID=A0A409VRE4_9AGAR|nr:hypothetical protein CVT24_007694 [Panaeolus cyanescens]